MLQESDRFTFADVHIRFPNMIICVEMIPLSIAFVWAYPWRVYLVGGKPLIDGSAAVVQFTKPYQGGPVGIYAWLNMLNPSDTIQAIVFGAQQSFGGRRGRNRASRPIDVDNATGEDQPLRSWNGA